MSEEVARRLDAVGVKGRSLTLKVMQRDPAAPVEAPKVRKTHPSLVDVIHVFRYWA
jgi:hypothetical protein